VPSQPRNQPPRRRRDAPAAAERPRRRAAAVEPEAPRARRRAAAVDPEAPKPHRRRKILVRLLALGLFFAVIGMIALLWYASTVPLPAEEVPQGTTVILAADGKTRIASLDGGEDRTLVRLDNVSPHMQNAVLAAEDRYFYSHGGVDPLGVARALVSDLRSKGVRQGGSTITQQYVKNVYVGRDRTAKRKVREAILAVKLEQKLSKDEILERYLNTIYFGRNAYGVQAASKAWFNKDAKDLGPQEATYLAALIRSPSGGDVDKDPATATRRRDSVVDAMVRIGSLQPPEGELVKATPIQTYVVQKRDRPPSVARSEIGMEYVVDYVRKTLIDTYGEKVVVAGGLTVTTSIDMQRQAEAFDAVYGDRPALQPGEPDGALVSVDEAGHIIALVGGRDHTESQVNLALGKEGGGGGRQPGSTFKPMLLAEVVHEGYSLDSAFPAPPKITLKGFDKPVENFDGESFQGQLNLVDATRLSVNTVYGQVAEVIGPEKVVEQAHRLGVTADLDAVPSAFLGTNDVSVLDMASAYSTFARQGVKRTPRIIIKVGNRDGETLDDGKVTSEEVLSPDEAATVTYALRQVVEHGTGVGAQLGRPAAGKTGTTNDNTNAWFVGFAANPRITTAVWMGWADNGGKSMDRVRGRPVNGGGLPASIWKAYMAKATAGAPSGDFDPLPDQGKKKTLPKASGRESTKNSTTLPPNSSTSSTLPSGSSTSSSTPNGSSTSSSSKPTTSTSKPSGTTTSSPPTTGAPTTVTTKPPVTTTPSTGP
jgi:membrane peptidoglycan carboxypeptidase